MFNDNVPIHTCNSVYADLITNHPAFTPQNELVSRHPGKRYEYPAFLNTETSY